MTASPIKDDRERSILTVDSFIEQFIACGLEAGQVVLLHSSMGAIGDWICGGTEAVITALQEVLTDEGTLMMPTHTADNTNPTYWRAPPVPEAWWDIVRQNMPAFDPNKTKTRMMGVIPEAFRTYPNVLRSNHPTGSFAAWGKHAQFLTADHNLIEMFGEKSPIGKLYELDGYILLLGVTHENNTSLHLAEYQAEFPGKAVLREGCAMFVEGKRQWVEFDTLRLETDDFEDIGTAHEIRNHIPRHHVGQAQVRFMKQRPLVDFAIDWMNKNRDLRA